MGYFTLDTKRTHRGASTVVDANTELVLGVRGNIAITAAEIRKGTKLLRLLPLSKGFWLLRPPIVQLNSPTLQTGIEQPLGNPLCRVGSQRLVTPAAAAASKPAKQSVLRGVFSDTDLLFPLGNAVLPRGVIHLRNVAGAPSRSPRLVPRTRLLHGKQSAAPSFSSLLTRTSPRLPHCSLRCAPLITAGIISHSSATILRCHRISSSSFHLRKPMLAPCGCGFQVRGARPISLELPGWGSRMISIVGPERALETRYGLSLGSVKVGHGRSSVGG